MANTVLVDTSFLTETNSGLFSEARLIRLCGQQHPLVFVGLVIERLLCWVLYGPPGTLSQWDYFLHLADKETERLGTMSSGEARWQEVLVPGDLRARFPWSPIRSYVS